MIEGRGPAPSFVLSLIDGLPVESMTMALVQGGEDWRDFYGWSRDSYLHSYIYDAINQNTKATGNFKKPPKIEPFPRPKKKRARKPKNLFDLWNMMTGKR